MKVAPARVTISITVRERSPQPPHNSARISRKPRALVVFRDESVRPSSVVIAALPNAIRNLPE
jgi:hypothetical protein